MSKLIFLIVFISFNLSAQVLLNTYKPIIPPVCIDSDSKRGNVSTMIEHLSEYNPALIYNYIVYLKFLADDPTSAKEAMQYLNYEKNEFLKEMAPWISNEFDIINSRSVAVGQWTRLWPYFYFLKQSPDEIGKKSPNYNIDQNYRDYTTYLSYIKEFREYESQTDYSQLLNEITSRMIEEFTAVYNNTGTLSEDKIEYYYEMAKNHPLLFKGSVLPYIDNPVPYYLAEFLLKLTSIAYQQKTTFNTGLEAGTDNSHINHSIVYSDESFQMGIHRHARVSNIFNFGLGANLKLREYKSYFSSLNVNLSIGYSAWESSAYDVEYLSRDYRVIVTNGVGTRVDPNLKTGSVNYSALTYQFKVSTPLIYFTSRLSLEGGLQIRFSDYKYIMQVSREDVFYQNRQNLSDDLLVVYDKETEFTGNQFDVFPLVTMNYLLSDLFTIRLSMFDTAELPQLQILYNFSL